MAWEEDDCGSGDPLEETVSVLLAAGRFAYGTDAKLMETAEEWLTAGFSPQDTHDWIEARCFESWAAGQLRAAGLNPDKAKLVPLDKKETIGYLVSSGALKVAEAKQIAGVDPFEW